MARHSARKRTRSEKIMIVLGLVIVVSMLITPLITILFYRQ